VGPTAGARMNSRRGARLISAALFSAGAAVTDLVAAGKAESPGFGVLLAAIGLLQLGVVGCAFAWPRQRVLWIAGLVSLALLAFWALTRLAGWSPGPPFWLAEDRFAGMTDFLSATLRLLAGMLFLLASSARRGTTQRSRVATFMHTAARALPALLISGILTFASLAFVANGDSPGPVGSPSGVPVGAMTTVTYCTLDGVRLAMDVYEPSAAAVRPAPAVVYVHGSVWLFGGRGSDGPYFDQLQRQLNDRGFVVASIDYRLAPLYPFPAQIEDPKCAARYLRAHAAELGIDPNKIAGWGASSGGSSTALMAMAGTPASWDRGESLDQSSRVQAVVDMSGPVDYAAQGASYSGPGVLLSKLVGASLFREPGAVQAASAVSYAAPRDVPFLIVHGTKDFVVPAAESQELADHLQTGGTPVRLMLIEGATHVGIDPAITSQIPTAVDFLSDVLVSNGPIAGPFTFHEDLTCPLACPAS